MNKKNLLIVIISIVVVAAGAGLITFSLKTAQPQPKTPASNPTGSQPVAEQHMNHENMNMDSSATVQQETKTVTIQNFAFNPANLTVKKGTLVKWLNQDTVRHSVISSGANVPKSELLGKGESYSFAFSTVGTFDYICGPHPYMKGSVKVTE